MQLTCCDRIRLCLPNVLAEYSESCSDVLDLHVMLLLLDTQHDNGAAVPNPMVALVVLPCRK